MQYVFYAHLFPFRFWQLCCSDSRVIVLATTAMSRRTVSNCTIGCTPSIHTRIVVWRNCHTIPSWRARGCLERGRCCTNRRSSCIRRECCLWNRWRCWLWQRWNNWWSVASKIWLNSVYQRVRSLPTLLSTEIIQIQSPEHGATQSLGLDNLSNLIVQAL